MIWSNTVAETSASAATTPTRPSRWRAYRSYVLVILGLIAFLSTLDQAILAVSVPAVQAEFRLTYAQVGFISGAIVVSSLAILPLGYAVDRFSRRAILSLGVGLWSLCTLLTGLAQSYAQILAARAVLGIGEATAVPASVSLLGDYFTKRDRGRAAGVIQAALHLGLALGLILGGILAARYGWRSAFFVAGLPGLILAVLALTLREPLRGAAETSPSINLGRHVAGGAAVVPLLRIRTFVAATLASTLATFATTGVGGFIALYTSRRFGVGLDRVGAMVGIPLLIGGVVGSLLGGWLVDWRGRRSPRAHLEVAAVTLALSAVAQVAVFGSASPSSFELLFFAAIVVGNLGLPGLLAINQNLVIPSLRGSATAIQQLASSLLGRALSLILIGLVADQLHNLGLALQLLAPAAFAAAAVAAALGLATMPRDVRAMEREWEQRAGGEAVLVPGLLPAAAGRSERDFAGGKSS